MIQSYVAQRIVIKNGKEWAEDRIRGTNREEDYQKMRAKVSREAFLAVRSRTGADFVGYFTSTICSVPQRLGERGFLEVARALHDEREVERVRSLTLLALSASS
jgi:CRISPR-associated protein Cmx8